MIPLDWVVSIGEIIAASTSEVINGGAVQEWAARGRADAAGERLLNLYGQMTVLEYTCMKFVDLIEQYIERGLERATGAPPSDGARWDLEWARIIMLQADEVATQMEAALKAIGELDPHEADAHAPKAHEFFKIHITIPAAESAVPIYIGKQYQPVSVSIPDEWARVDSAEAFLETAAEIIAAVSAIIRVRNELGEFIGGWLSWGGGAGAQPNP